MSIELQRIYDSPPDAGGHRVLVDRLWPRGISRAAARLDEWAKHLGPSDELRKWFNHDPARWKNFQAKYRQELAAQADELERLRTLARKQNVVLLYGAKDTEHNQAVVLRDVLKNA